MTKENLTVPSRLPPSAARLLARAVARARRVCLVRGIAVVGIVWLVGVAAVMAVDSRIVIFDDRIRWAMTAGVWLLALVAAMLAVVLPLRRRFDFRRMAAVLDARHPEQEERLTTLVELAGKDAAAAGFSASLFALVCDLAERDVAKIDLVREFPMFKAWRRIAVFAALALSLGLGTAISPNLVGRLFVRAVAPWVDIGNLFSNDIAVTPGDIVVLSGSVIKIEATSTRSSAAPAQDFSIRLSRRTGLGWSEETSEPMPNGVYETTADINEREWRYRVNAGPAVTRYYHVRVSQMPKYDLFTATVEYPDYTGLRPLVVSNADVAAIKAIQGTRVAFDVRVSEPGTLVDFRIGGTPTFAHTMVSNRTTNWSLDLVNRDGFRAEKGRHPLTSFVDQPPTVVIEKPTGTLRLPPHAKIPVEITASDDIAITSAWMRVSIDGDPWEVHYGTKIALPGSRTPFLRTVADVDLSLYNLIFAKNIRFDVVVEDACPPAFGGPHSATSMPFVVQFNENESNWELRELRHEVDEARRDIDEARKRLSDAQTLARQVMDELRRNAKPTENAERNSERMAHELSEARKRIEELRDAFRPDERFEPLTRPMDRLLDESVKPALEQVEKAQFRERTERADEVERAIPEMEKGVRELEELSKRLTERAEKVDALEKAKDLADRQEALAKAAKEIMEERPMDTAKLEAWKRLEEAAMRRAEELSRTKSDPELAEARRMMETAARKMAELKRELDEAHAQAANAKKEAEAHAQRKKQEAAREANELRNAAAQQKQAEAALARKDVPGGDRAQRAAEEALKRGNALPAVKEFQRQASESKVLEDQQAAAEALKKEQDVREAVAKGEKSEKDLAKLDDELRRQLRERAKEKARTSDAAKPTPNGAPAKDAAKAAAETAEGQARNAAAADQRRAMEAIAAAAAQRAEELARRRANATADANAKAKNAAASERQAAEAQRAAEEKLKKGKATEGVRAMQELASAVQRNAQQSPRSAEKAAAASAAQREAADALREEESIRDGIKKGEKTAADLEAFDRALRATAAEKSAALAKTAAEEAVRERQRAAKAAAQAKELQNAANDQKRALDALGRNDFNAAANNQRAAEDRLERAEAMPAVKALQQLASEAARNAGKSPQTKEKTAAAVAAQKAASDAVRREQAVREGIRKGELTDDDLDLLDKELKEGLLKQAAARTKSAEAAADAAVAAAKKALGSVEQEALEALADAALEARRDAVGAARAESKLRNDDRQAEALRESENALDAVEASDAEASALEKRILSLQQSALEALQRNDRRRVPGLQKEIAQAQARAAESLADASDAKSAREEASAAQEAAQEAMAAANRAWSNETKQKAVDAQKAAMERERAAQREARAVRAVGKVAAAEKPVRAEGVEEAPTPSADGPDSISTSTAKAASEAADAMRREVKAQATALGMKPRRQQGGASQEKSEKKDAASGGGGIADEVRDLAKELRRNDSPDFFKKLFSNFGWFKIRGVSKDGFSEHDLKDVPLEYRDLVRRYFLKLAEENP